MLLISNVFNKVHWLKKTFFVEERKRMEREERAKLGAGAWEERLQAQLGF